MCLLYTFVSPHDERIRSATQCIGTMFPCQLYSNNCNVLNDPSVNVDRLRCMSGRCLGVLHTVLI